MTRGCPKAAPKSRSVFHPAWRIVDVWHWLVPELTTKMRMSVVFGAFFP